MKLESENRFYKFSYSESSLEAKHWAVTNIWNLTGILKMFKLMFLYFYSVIILLFVFQHGCKILLNTKHKNRV